MAGIFELNSFVGKFVNLWQAGRNVSLKLDSQAGQASVTLQLDLGQPVPPQHLQTPHPYVQTTAQDRRRQRRADVREATAAEAKNVNAVEASTKKHNAEIQDVVAAEEAVATEETADKTDGQYGNAAEEVVAVTAEGADKASKELSKAVSYFECEECGRKFENEVNLRTHKVREHKVTSSPIPQVDGASEFDVVSQDL